MEVQFEATVNNNRYKIRIEYGDGVVSISNIHGDLMISTSRWMPETARRIAYAILDAAIEREEG